VEIADAASFQLRLQPSEAPGENGGGAGAHGGRQATVKLGERTTPGALPAGEFGYGVGETGRGGVPGGRTQARKDGRRFGLGKQFGGRRPAGLIGQGDGGSGGVGQALQGPGSGLEKSAKQGGLLPLKGLPEGRFRQRGLRQGGGEEQGREARRRGT